MVRTRKWVVAGLLLCSVTGLQAQATRNLNGAVELGWRSFTDKLATTELGKFEEYTHTPQGVYLRFFELNWSNPDGLYGWGVKARDVGERDQQYGAEQYRLGLYKLELGWSQLPHTFSTTARLLGSAAPPFTLPNPRPDTASWNRASYIGAVRTVWDPARVGLTITPRPDLDFQAEYVRIAKSGERPMGMAMGSPGSNFREILEPIDQTTHHLRLAQSLARAKYQFQVAYDLSVFQNAVESVVADNPLIVTDGQTSGSSRGRSALAPDNIAHTVNGVGGFNLPLNSRLTAAGSYSWRKQDEPFIPYTVNSVLASQLAPGAGSLQGDVRVARFTLAASSRPLHPLSLRARYSYFDLNDHTPQAEFKGEVVNDRTLTAEELIVQQRYPFTKQNAAADAAWRFGSPAKISFGYAWEQWERNAELRNVARTTEHALRSALDISALDRLDVRATVSRSYRRGTDYQQVSTIQLPLQRRFDQADRIRDRIDVNASVYLLEGLTVGGNYGRGRDDYDNSSYGLLNDKSQVLGGLVQWSLLRRLHAYGSYERERFDSEQRSRYRQSTMLDNTTFDWIAQVEDRISTVAAGLTAELLPGRLEAGAQYDWSKASASMNAHNPTTPAGGTTAQNNSARAVDYPDILQRFNPASAWLRYSPTPNWSATVGFQYEKYQDDDFRNNNLNPATTADIFLGNEYRDYKAGILSFSIQYRLPVQAPAQLASREASRN
jgi:MtrB/PioB family decaheme-associated outer membrane protein